MKKLITILFILIGLFAQSQDIKPNNSELKKLIAPNTPIFYYNPIDSSVWVYKGAYGWTKMADSARVYKDYVPYENAWMNVNLDTMAIRTGYVDLVQKENPFHGAYRLFADTAAHTVSFYNDELDISMQIGQEMWSRVLNNSGGATLNGTVVRITGSTATGIPTINLASNDYHIEADGVLGVATHDIESNTYGFITTLGEVHGLNTSGCPEGGIIYLGVDGAYTHIRPVSPNFVIEIGTCLYSHATDGTILVNIKGSPYDIIHSSFNTIFIESMKFTVNSDGTTITGSLERTGGGDLTMQFSDGFTTLDCTPIQTITLTAGTATVPQTNYIYVPRSTKTLTVSTSGWPAEEAIRISEVAVRTAILTQSDGVLRNQNWNDHIAGVNGTGHISHINERIRQFNADYFAGIDPSVNVVSAATPDNVYFSTTAGKVYQMHLQDFPAQSMPTDDIHIVNHFTTPYATVTNLNTQLTDAVNGTLSNRSFSFVIWGVQNESGEASHLMLNLPIGSYSSGAEAMKDVNNYSVYTIPKQFKGVGFLIARITFSHSPSGSGTWTLDQVQDLRGYIPNSTAGGGAAGGGGGVTTYLGLTDTPNAYTANKLHGSNSLGTAMEEKGATATLAGTINIPTGQTYQINGTPLSGTNIANTPAGTIAATNVQTALNELDTEKEPAQTKGNLTESVTGLQFSATRQVIGGAADLSLSSGYAIPTTTDVTNWNNAVSGTVTKATLVESTTGTDDVKYITPLKLIDVGKLLYVPYANATDNVNLGTFGLTGDSIKADVITLGGTNIITTINNKVADVITDGVTTIAPSQNAVFDALALKLPVNNPTATGILTTPNLTLSGSGFTNSGYGLRVNGGGVVYAEALTASQVYKGTWSATTNTPTLANGTGTAGWYYRVTTAGTVNFGAGNITFSVGDDVSYNGTIWERIPAATIMGNELSRVNDTNVTLTLGGSPETALVNAASMTLGWTGTLADSRITSSGNWNTSYNDKVNSLAVTGTTTKTITLNQQDGGTITGTFTDNNTTYDLSPYRLKSDTVLLSGTASNYDLALKENAFTKNTGFNKNFGSVSGTVLEGRTFGTAANNNTGDFEVPLTFSTGLNRTGNTITSTITQFTTANEIDPKFALDSSYIKSHIRTDLDKSITNEGSLTVAAGTSTTSVINSNTSGSTGVTLSVDGTNLGISEAGNTISLSNLKPDQTVSLANGTGISNTGTYPNFTITNTSPDQTVSIASGTGISATGTYPNFTVTNTAPNVTTNLSVTGTSSPLTLNSSDGTDVTITAGTGISLAGTSGNITVTNTAPNSDQTITLSGDVTGTGTTSIVTTVVDDSHSHTTATLPNIVSSIDGVVNDGGNIDLIQGGTVTITPNDAANTITISSADQYEGTVTSVFAGNGLTQTGTATTNPTININSHAGSAGTIGTVNVGADAIGVNLGNTSITAMRGDYGTDAYNDKVNSMVFTGTTEKTLTLNQQDGGTLTANFTDNVNDADYDHANEIQDLSRTGNTLSLSMDATTVDLSDFVNPDLSGYRLKSDTVLLSGTASHYDLTLKENTFSKNTGFNLNLGDTIGTILEGRTFGDAANSGIATLVESATGTDTSKVITPLNLIDVTKLISVPYINALDNLYLGDYSIQADTAIFNTLIGTGDRVVLTSPTGQLKSGVGSFGSGDVTNWNTAYNDKINSLAFTGTTTKTLTLAQQDGGTITGTFTDLNTTYDLSPYKLIADSTAATGYTRRDRLASQISTRVAKNTAITGSTKTKITYDSKGLVTAGSDATTEDIADSSNKRYVTDTQLSQIHTSGSDNQNLGYDGANRTVTIDGTGSTDAVIPIANGTIYGLSINDYTTVEKGKLSGIATGAEVNVNADWNAVSGDALILNKPTLFTTEIDPKFSLDSAYIKSHIRTDLDKSATNELQTISKVGSTVTLSNSGGSFTDDNTTYSAGTGMSLVGTTFNNTAPDQTVVLNNGTGIIVTGTYPTFTIANSSPNVVQTISTTGASGNISISGGNTLNLNVNDADASVTNEIQDLSLSGNILTLSSDATTVDISNATAVLANTAKVTNATHSGDASGSTVLTLATVNSNIGTYNNVTINAKGLATAGSNVAYLTSEVDGSTTNELNTSMSWDNSTNTVSVTDAGGAKSVAITGFIETLPTEIYNEIPAGTPNSSLLTFTTANTPTTSTVTVYLNGLKQRRTIDYTISGNIITFVSAPITGDIILTDYKY